MRLLFKIKKIFLKIFDGAFDQDTVVAIDLEPPVLGRYFRVVPLSWSGGIALRMEFVGCTQDEQRYCKLLFYS